MLFLVTLAFAEPVPLSLVSLSSFQVGLIVGKEQKRGEDAHGIVLRDGLDLSQSLTWQPAEGELKSALDHERALVARGAERAGSVPHEIVAPKSTTVAKLPALTFTVRVDNTTFVGTSFDCPLKRVTLVTSGSDPITVEATHARSLTSVACALPK